MGGSATKFAQKGYDYVTGTKSNSQSSKDVEVHQGNYIRATAFVLKRSRFVVDLVRVLCKQDQNVTHFSKFYVF